jgi:virginiamycin B lyase
MTRTYPETSRRSARFGIDVRLRSHHLARRFALASAVVVALLVTATAANGKPMVVRGVERFLLPSSTWATALSFDRTGAPWFVTTMQRPEMSVGSIDSGGTVHEYRLPSRSNARPASESIVLGAEGDLWFADPPLASIGRVGTDGDVSEFPVPNGARPGDLAVDREGNVWFTEPGTGQIGRLTPAGLFQEFSVGSHSRPAGITLGPDGSIWFTEQRGGKIGRIESPGTLRLFKLGRGVRPNRIVTGADGNLWFSEQVRAETQHRASVGRITTSGRVSKFRLPFPGTTELIAADPSGRIWLGSSGGYSFSSISTSGKFLRRFCLNSTCTLPVEAIAIAADGSLWFSDGIETCSRTCGGGSTGPNSLAKGIVGRVPPGFLGPSAHPR